MSEFNAANLPNMSIREIALAVRANWAKVSPYAKPYLDAMMSLNKISDPYYADSGVSVVLYFLANAGGFRGDVAKAIKVELKRRAA